MRIEELFIDQVFACQTNFTLPETTLFYQKDQVQKAGSAAFVCLFFVTAFFRRYFIALGSLIGALGLAYINLQKEYFDSEVRKKYRSELEDGLLRVEEYVAKHGWENIQRFGFEIHPLNGSLIDKKELVQRVFDQLHTDFATFFHKRDAELHFYRGFLWQCFDEGMFAEDDIDQLRKMFQEKIQALRLVDLFENYQDLKERGFFAGLDSKIIQFFEEYWMKFSKVEQEFIHYREKILAAFQREKSTLKYPDPITLHQKGKPPIVMPDSRKLNIYYESLAQMKQKYLKEYERLKDFRDEGIYAFQTRFDELFDR